MVAGDLVMSDTGEPLKEEIDKWAHKYYLGWVQRFKDVRSTIGLRGQLSVTMRWPTIHGGAPWPLPCLFSKGCFSSTSQDALLIRSRPHDLGLQFYWRPTQTCLVRLGGRVRLKGQELLARGDCGRVTGRSMTRQWFEKACVYAEHGPKHAGPWLEASCGAHTHTSSESGPSVHPVC